MLSFFKKLFGFLFFAFLPLLILLAGYIYYDPFKVVWSYKDYYSSSCVTPNRDYVSTEFFLRNYNKVKYNSFIFGSSRTSAFSPVSWKKQLHDTDRVMVFDASGEGIYGIYTKLKFLDKKNVSIDNALILFCRDAIFKKTDNFDNHIGIKHPSVSGESWLYFHYVSFRDYLDSKFLLSFYNYMITKKYKPFMKGFIEEGKISYDSVFNGLDLSGPEKEIENNLYSYYHSRGSIFYQQKGEKTDSVQGINDKSLNMLVEIKKILLKHHTKYKIILSPIYDQVKFYPADLLTLENLFGNNVYDFTGYNNITKSKYNWYENNHFRRTVGDSILQIIYKN